MTSRDNLNELIENYNKLSDASDNSIPKEKDIKELKRLIMLKLYYFEKMKNHLSKMAKECDNIICSECEHDWDDILEPHDRTHYICKKCNLYQL